MSQRLRKLKITLATRQHVERQVRILPSQPLPTDHATIGRMNRVKVSVSVDPVLLRAVDEFVQTHEGVDRSKVIDEALGLWSAARQDEAMAAQFASPDEPTAERSAWRATRRAGATRRLHRA